MRERLEKAGYEVERNLLFCLLGDYGNYKRVKKYTTVDDFNCEEYKNIFTLISILYDSANFKSISKYTIKTISYDKGMSNDDIATLESFVDMASMVKEDMDFEGTYSLFRKINGMRKLVSGMQKYGGFENYFFNLYEKSNNAEEIKNGIDNVAKACFKEYRVAIQSCDMSKGMVDYIKNEMFVSDGNSIPFDRNFFFLQQYSKGIHVGVTFIGGHSGTGKCLPLTSKLYTKDGYILMKDVKIGDEIFGEDGKLHKVVGVFPQGKKQKVRITFSDNTFTDCCEDHLWSVYESSRKPKSKVRKLTPQEVEDRWQTTTMSVKEIIEKGWLREGYDSKQNRPMFSSKLHIPITKPVEFEKKEHYIDPYLLGVLIGDGYLLGTGLAFSTSEEYIYKKVDSILKDMGYEVRRKEGDGYRYRIANILQNAPNKLKQEIYRLELNVKSHEKFIPNEYKFDSVENRLALLRGIFDTDGSVRGARTTISTISPKLKDDIIWLCQSLGMTATVSEDVRDKYVGNDRCYSISIQFNEGFEPFTSPKHSSRYTKPKRKQFVRRYIRNIEYLDEYVEMQCISVDNPTKLYLTNNFIVTHNTTITIPFFCIPILESGQKLLCIGNEQTANEFRQLFLMAYIALVKKDTKGIFRQNMNYEGKNRFTPEQYEYMCECAREFEERYNDKLQFVFTPRFTEDELESLIEEYHRLGYNNVLLDTFKQEDSTNGWEGMDNMAKRMDGLSKDLGLKIICTVQLAQHVSWRRYLTANCIGKAKSIKEVATSLYMFRWLRPEEIPNIKYQTLKRDETTGKLHPVTMDLEPYYIDKHREKRNKNYIALFNDKQRKSECGHVIIYEADLGRMYFREMGITYSIKNDDNGK